MVVQSKTIGVYFKTFYFHSLCQSRNYNYYFLFVVTWEAYALFKMYSEFNIASRFSLRIHFHNSLKLTPIFLDDQRTNRFIEIRICIGVPIFIMTWTHGWAWLKSRYFCSIEKQNSMRQRDSNSSSVRLVYF